MSGASITIDLRGLKALQHKIDKLAGLTAADLFPALDALGEVVENQTRRRISEEKKAPDGSDWPELDKKYAKKKAKLKPEAGLLEFEGNLVDSMTHNVLDRSVEIGTPLIYGATHQFGDDKRNIKARPYLGLSSENEEEIESVMDDFIAGMVAA